MDTILLLKNLGPGCHFLGHGSDDDINELERILKQELELNPGKPPVVALFTEFPSNPLLRSVNLSRLRALADTYDFQIVVDDTIGNYANVQVFPYADIVVTSLSKAFSGEANVLGGRYVPQFPKNAPPFLLPSPQSGFKPTGTPLQCLKGLHE